MVMSVITEDPHGDELGLPIMHGEDYNRFSAWLETFETDDVWTLDQLVEIYEIGRAHV